MKHYCDFNPLNPKIKIRILIVALIHFLPKLWGEVDKIASKVIWRDPVRNSRDHSIL